MVVNRCMHFSSSTSAFANTCLRDSGCKKASVKVWQSVGLLECKYWRPCIWDISFAEVSPLFLWRMLYRLLYGISLLQGILRRLQSELAICFTTPQGSEKNSMPHIPKIWNNDCAGVHFGEWAFPKGLSQVKDRLLEILNMFPWTLLDAGCRIA